MTRILTLALLLASLVPAGANNLIISEFLARNDSGLQDEDGEFSDWIEVYNAGTVPVDLAGWHLTDATNNLTKWTFPSVPIAPGGFLLVFASGKDRSDPGSELHASFQLDGDGEYLALVRPNLSVASDFFPTFPEQRDDISYGLDFTGVRFLREGDSVEIHVPTDNSMGQAWISNSFTVDELLWQDGITAAGYGATVTTPSELFQDLLNYWNFEGNFNDTASSIPGNTSAVNDHGTTPGAVTITAGGPLGSHGSFPGGNPDYVAIPDSADVVASGENLSISAWFRVATFDEDWQALIAHGEGSDYRIARNSGGNNLSYAGGTGDISGGAVVNDGLWHHVVAISEHGVSTRLWVDGDFAGVGGAPSLSNSGAGRMMIGGNPNTGPSFRTWNGQIDDVAIWGRAISESDITQIHNEGLRGISFGNITASGTVNGTDLEPIMKGVNSSAYLRIPFTGADPAALDSLTLLMRYNDGFVAYVNGVEVARRNAPPGPPAWNAAATQARSPEQSAEAESINITPFINTLLPGINILAIHGLNVAANDHDFLIAAEMIGGGLTVGDRLFFNSPSPAVVNSGGITFGVVADTKFSHNRGFYTNTIQVAITSATPDAEIRYTLDHTWPSPNNGLIYSTPVTITTTTVLKAMAHKPGSEPTDVDTQTYLFLEDVLRQPAVPAGFEPYTSWGAVGSDYEVDPDVVNNPLYSSTLIDDLKSLPVMSLSMPKPDLFGSSGIYRNSGGSGIAWERAGTIEMFLPDGTTAFSQNCGVRMHGGVGRNAEFFKHNFRLLFKSNYGPSKLRYPLFGDDATDSFDTLILRAGFNNTWHRGSGGEELRAQYLRDEFIRRTQLALGDPSGHGSFCHLYVDGLYWGLYNFVERPSAPFCADYFGGAKEDWDVLNSSSPIDGNKTSWTTAINLANAGVASDPAYDLLSQHVDIPNLINYFLLNIYGGNLDWDDHNWYSGKRRLEGDGFKFFSWDAERSLENTTGDNRTGVNQDDKPSRIYAQLRANTRFREQFADQAHAALFNGGPLSETASIARYQELADLIDRAIVGESARWGDTKRATPYTRNAEWVAERDRLLTSYLPQRTSVVLSFLRSASLYPSVDAPVFNQHGGIIPPGFPFFMNAPSGGTIYYTEDGSDPRLPGGGINPDALTYEGVTLNATLIARGSVWKYLDDGSNQGTAWRELAFDDASWAQGPAQLGYGDGDEATVVSYGPNANNKHITTYFRHSWNVPDISRYTSLSVDLQRDDGAVVYLNGTEVFRSNLGAGPIDHLTLAANGSAQDSVYLRQNADVGLLIPGTNVVAVEIHQTSGTSSDITFNLGLLASGPGSDPLTLDHSAVVKARVWTGTQWSALNQALFVTDEPPPLRVSELMFHSASAEGIETNGGFSSADFDFIELQNTSSKTIGLAGIRFVAGIEFDFSTSAVSTLNPGQHVVVVQNLAAFQTRYPQWNQILIAGQYQGSLDNGGEQITLANPALNHQLDINYADNRNWPLPADGAGHSLVPLFIQEILDPATHPLDYGKNWRASAWRGGSPGEADPDPTQDLLLNEFAAHTDYPGPIYDSNDWIELFNTSPTSLSLSNWFLSDDPNQLRKWPIPPATTVPARDWISFDEVTGFHNPITNGFGLNKAGERLYLSHLPGPNPGRVADAFEFTAQENGATEGRYPDGTHSWSTLLPTRNTANTLAPQGIVISEVMYHPPPTATHPEDNANDEFIVLHNPGPTAVPLFNTEGSWRLAGEVVLSFPTGLTLAAGGELCLVSFDPNDASSKAAFLAAYGLADGALTLAGPYAGKLSNRGGRVALERPQAGDLIGDPLSWVVVDEFYYFDSNPFSEAADGTGLSLHRLDPTLPGRDPSNWLAALPTPSGGTVVTPSEILRIEALSPLLRRLTWDPVPGADYTIEAANSVNAANWTPIGTVTTNSAAEFIPAPSAFPQRFYRLRRP